MDISQKNQIILFEPIQRIAITGLIQGSILEPGLGDGAMEQSYLVRDFRSESANRREDREGSGSPRGGVGQKSVLNCNNTESNVFYFVVACFIKVIEIGDFIFHDGGDEILLFRQILAIVMVATNNNGGGNGGEPLKEVNPHFNPRGSDTVLVVKEIARDNNEGFVQGREGSESLKEVLKDLDILFFSGTFRVACSDMDIRDVKDMMNWH
jgi:hypothetical protein